MMSHTGINENPKTDLWTECASTTTKLENIMVNPHKEKMRTQDVLRRNSRLRKALEEFCRNGSCTQYRYRKIQATEFSAFGALPQLNPISLKISFYPKVILPFVWYMNDFENYQNILNNNYISFTIPTMLWVNKLNLLKPLYCSWMQCN